MTLPLASFTRTTSCFKRLYEARAFSVALPPTPAKTKTKKAFADLPSTYVRPDGTVAEPLGQWSSGPNVSPPSCSSLDVSTQRTSKRRTAMKDVVKQPPNFDANVQTSDNRPKRAKKRAPRASVHLSTPDPETLTKSADAVASDSKPKRTRKKLDSPQGPTSKQPTTDITETNNQPQTILAQEILENLRKFPHCLLLTRVGQFYESYFDQATEISRLLGIKLTTRKWGNGRVPMCGFPLAHLDKYLKVLVQQNKRFVAMCEEFPRYSEKTRTFDRRVTRVVTPGTLIDEPFLNPFENNYLLAIGILGTDEALSTDNGVGLAWIDVSTGEFFSRSTNIDGLRDELTRIAPREVVLDGRLQQIKEHPIYEALAEDDNFISYIIPTETSSEDLELPFDSVVTDACNPGDLSGKPVVRSRDIGPDEALAIRLLTAYLHANLLEHMPVLSPPNHEANEERMQIDSHTIKALEIREGFREGGTKGSLLSGIKRTVTIGGTRLLSRWLCSPSTSISEINARQALVAFLHSRPHFHADIAEALANTEDTIRISQKFILGRGETADLLGIKRTIRTWTGIIKRVQHEKEMESIERSDFNIDDWASLDALISRMIPLDSLSKRISTALDDKSSHDLPESTSIEASTGEDTEEIPVSEDTEEIPVGEDIEKISVSEDTEEIPVSEDEEILPSDTGTPWRPGTWKGTIKPSFSTTLMSLHDVLQKLLFEREEMERNLQLSYDAPSLTLRVSPAHGMHVHLAKAKRDQTKIIANPEFVSIAESASTRCFFFKDWSLLASQIAEKTLALTLAEKEAFEVLRHEVNGHSQSLRRNARLLDELDVAMSFATLASELNFARPKMTNEPIYQVINGRHPTVELGLLATGRVFAPNSVALTTTSRLHVITGPNMAGKSTFLRQTALIAILAQTGSFVPADFAVLGIVDRLFSRVGAKDDLFHDRSTFMVEMLETAEILRRATPKSLVIMDEVGRGTTVTDGLAIAYATLHHLVNTNQCRALYATHFHELSDMLGYPNQNRNDFGSVEFFCTDVDETDDAHFAYQYRLRPGVNRDSHGLKVAQLAGMPVAAVNVAKDTLTLLKTREADSHRIDCKGH
ncbi:MutS like protein [Termitomyces sp. T112]|nr:MutS like protein [Termitomyces sp. T112]